MPSSWQRFDAGAFEYFKLQLSPMTMTTIITIITMIMIITETIPIIDIINGSSVALSVLMSIVVIKPMGLSRGPGRGVVVIHRTTGFT